MPSRRFKNEEERMPKSQVLLPFSGYELGFKITSTQCTLTRFHIEVIQLEMFETVMDSQEEEVLIVQGCFQVDASEGKF